MNILLTNDDGVHAMGLNTLHNVLSEKHNVYVIAPHEEKSGTSNAMSFKIDFTVTEIDKNIYSVHGFPADCVNIGLRGDIIPKVDLVISGINHGPNLGDDIYFSGTAGAARVACICGIPGIAISVNRHGESQFFHDASKFLLDYIENIHLIFNRKNLFFNINYPDLHNTAILGIKYSSLGKRRYNDNYKTTGKKDRELTIKFNFGNILGPIENDGSDISELEKGYITITPVSLDCTDYEFLKNMPATLPVKQ